MNNTQLQQGESHKRNQHDSAPVHGGDHSQAVPEEYHYPQFGGLSHGHSPLLKSCRFLPERKEHKPLLESVEWSDSRRSDFPDFPPIDRIYRPQSVPSKHPSPVLRWPDPQPSKKFLPPVSRKYCQPPLRGIVPSMPMKPHLSPIFVEGEFAQAQKYLCTFEECGVLPPTDSAPKTHYQNTRVENLPARKESANASLTVTTAEDKPNPPKDLTMQTDELLPAQLSGVAGRYAHRPEIVFLAYSTNSNSNGPKPSGGSEAAGAPEWCKQLNPSAFCSSPAEHVFATPELSKNLFTPSPVDQRGSSYAIQACDQRASRSPSLKLLYGNPGVPLASSCSDLDHAAKHRCSPKNKLEVAAGSTQANTVVRLAADDALLKPARISPNSTTRTISEDCKPTCGTGIDYPVSGAANHYEVKHLDRFDGPSSPVPFNARNNQATDYTSDPQIQNTKPPEWESVNLDVSGKGMHEDNHKIVAFAITGRSLNYMPIIAWACHPAVGHGPVLTAPMEAFNDSKPDKEQVTAQYPRSSFVFHPLFRHLHSPPLAKYSRVFAAAVECLAVSQGPEQQRQATQVLHSGLPTTRPSTAHSRQQKFRIIRILALLHYHSLGWEPTEPSSSFEYGQGSGSSQAPEGIDLRLEDGTGIWSGQGPGPGLSPTLEEFLNSIDIPELSSQGPDPLLLEPTYDLIVGSFSQQPNYSPPPPIPLGECSAGPSAGQFVGPSAGNFAENFAGYPQWYSQARAEGRAEGLAEGRAEGVAYAKAALADIMESTIQPLINQMTSMRETLAAIGIPKTALSSDSDCRAQAKDIATVDSEASPNPRLQPINSNSSSGLSQVSATQTAIPDADADSGPNSSDLAVMSNDEVQTPVHPSPILDDIPPTNGPEVPPIPASQTPPFQPKQQPTVSHEPAPTSGAPFSREGTNTPKHRCDRCDKWFRRPHLLEDHKRTHTGEETSTYHCKFKGCTRVYKSHSNRNRHYKSHFRGNSSQNPLSMSDAQMPEETVQSPGTGPSTQNVGNRTDRGTSTLSDVRFRPYETPDTVRHKIVQRRK